MNDKQSEVSTSITFEQSEESDCMLVVILSVEGHDIMRSDTPITYEQAEGFLDDLKDNLGTLKNML